MGSKLANEVWDRAPYALTTSQRLLLGIVAVAASDEDPTGICQIAMNVLARRMRVTPRRVNMVLLELAHLGFEVRVALGVDAGGNAIYAHTYRLPVFEQEEDPFLGRKDISRELPPSQ